MVLVTSDMRVYTSSDWGDSWTQVTTSGLTLSSLGLGGSITYNPGGSEVWINAPAQQGDGGIFKSAATDLTSWQDVSPSPGYGSWFLTFTSAGSVYVSRFHSTNGGTRWDPFGPSPWYGYGAFVFDPTHPQTAYITNDAVGVQKTVDLLDPTPTWQDKVEGLTALSCTSMAVSPTDPLRVYAAFYGPLGIYRSLDGTSTWSFLPIPGAWQVRRVVVDPFDAQRVYAGADSGFYASSDGGDHWTGTAWNLPPSATSGLLDDGAADPCQPGHLLACFGGYAVPRLLYSSTNYGASWQAVDVNLGLGEQWPHCIAFDPATPGTVYLTATGVYKSTDYGLTWRRIDDPKQPGMATAGDIAIATHPQHTVAVDAFGQLYRSVDGGATLRTETANIVEFPIPMIGLWKSVPMAIAAGPDGNLWFVESSGNKLAYVTTSGTIVECPPLVPAPLGYPSGIVVGTDGNLWFTESASNKIGHTNPSGGNTPPMDGSTTQPSSDASAD